MKDNELEYFKKELNKVLEEQQDKESVLSVKKSAFMINEICKSLFNPAYTSDALEVMKAGRGHLVPKQITTTNKKTGKTYTTTVWVNPNKQNGLKKYTEQDSKGAKIAIGKLMKKIDACNSVEELYSLVLRNKSRFSDNEGKPLPIVEKLHDCVEAKGSRIETQAKKKENAKKLTSSRSARLDGGAKEERQPHSADKKQPLANVRNVTAHTDTITPQGDSVKQIKGVAARLRDEFTENTNKYLDHSFKNNATGIEAKFSKESQKEMRSRTFETKENGFTLKEHFEVANQIKELFENATLENTHEDVKYGDKDVKIERFLSKEIILKSGKKAQACITVKHTISKNGRTLYSIEAMDIKNALEKTRAKGQDHKGDLSNTLSIADNADSVKQKAVEDFEKGLNFKLQNDTKEKLKNEMSEYTIGALNEVMAEFIKKITPFTMKHLDETIDNYNAKCKKEKMPILKLTYMVKRDYLISLKDKENEHQAHENRSEAMKGNQNAKKDFSELSEALQSGKNITLENAELGDVIIEAGETGKHGYGLKHIIEQRYVKDGKNADEISALCQLLMDTVRSGEVTRDNARTAEISKNGIVAIVRKEPNDKGFNWVLTGFDNTDTAEEQKKATDAIKTVIANNSYAQERSSFREQVGAVIDSIQPPKNTVNNQNSKDLSENASSRLDKGVAEIRKHYESTKSVLGGKKSVVLPNGEKIKCRYKIVEADAPTASHNEITFASSDNFPTNANGQNINDRDYQHDEDAKMSVISIGNNYNALALQDLPVVTKDGVVVSGNNRTMSSKLAAKNGRDKAYLAELKEQLSDGEFNGLDEKDLEGFEHPRLILEIEKEHEGKYTTEEFAQFNKDTKKTMNNVEKAVKLTKTLNAEKIQSIADSIQNYETMGELYQDKQGGQEFVQKLINAGIIGENEKAQYLQSDGLLNDTGKDFVETVLVGTILDENNIRGCDSEGGKSIRKKLLRAILPLVENKGTGKEYSFNKELNEAVSLILEVNNNKEFSSIDAYTQQQDMFGGGNFDPFAVQFAKILKDEGEKKFAERMKNLNAGCRESSNGAMDIFLGGVESKETLLSRWLDIKDSVKKSVKKAFNKFFALYA